MIAEPRTIFTARPIAPNSPRERKDPYAGKFWCKPLAQRGPVIGPACAEKRLRRKSRTPSLRAEFLRQHENLAGALDLGPAAVPFGDQRLQRFRTRGAFERGLIGEFICRLVDRGIADAPEPPSLLHAKRLHRVGQVLAAIPRVKRRALGGIGNGGADDEKGCWHWRFSKFDFRSVVPGQSQRVGALRHPMTGSGLNPESGDCKLEIPGSRWRAPRNDDLK